MVKFKLRTKGVITQYFGGSPASNPTQYTVRGQSGHSGIDSQLGWNAPVECDNDGMVYKVFRKENSSENWQGVYMLVHDKDDEFVEVCQGHFNTILVREGYHILEGTVIGLEGNKGYVFSGGVQITPAMQEAGDKRGHHVHTSYRPVRRVSRVKRGEQYLLTVAGVKYQDPAGNYYEIINKDNGFKGCVNPYLYLYENSIQEKLTLLQRLLPWLLARYNR